MKTRILVVRHATKGNGKDTGPSNLLSAQGELDSRNLGENLPESMKSEPISFIGGSVHSRSLMTAMLIAAGAKADPQILASDVRLGSESEFWKICDKQAFMDDLAESKDMMATTKRLLSPTDLDKVKQQMIDAILDAGKLGGYGVLGTHNPWVSIALEAITCQHVGNCPELGYMVLDVEDGQITVVETTIPTWS